MPIILYEQSRVLLCSASSHGDTMQFASRCAAAEAYGIEGHMESRSNILTIKEVAETLRCSKGHGQNVLVGKVRGFLNWHIFAWAAAKAVRKEWLEQWMEAYENG